MNITLSVDATGGRLRASTNHTTWAKPTTSRPLNRMVPRATSSGLCHCARSSVKAPSDSTSAVTSIIQKAMVSTGTGMAARRIICVPMAQQNAANRIMSAPVGRLPRAPNSCHSSSNTPRKAAPTPHQARPTRRSRQTRLPSTAEKIGMV